MLDLAICSFFKDSQEWGGLKINQIDRYFNQIKEQNLEIDWKIFAIEGNSSDDTRFSLEGAKLCGWNMEIIDDEISKDSPVQSTTSSSRMKTLNDLGNFMLEKVKGKARNYLWLESDLIIPDYLIDSLLFAQNRSKFDIVAPVITEQTRDIFYDIWGFVNLDGSEWQPQSHLVYEQEGERYKELKSIGSCALISGNIVNSGINFGDNCFRGLCQNARNAGYKVGVDLETRIFHPSRYFINGRLV